MEDGDKSMELRKPVLITLKNVSHFYDVDRSSSPALENVNLTIYQGGTYAIVGASGSGKSTVLNILGLLDNCATGEYWYRGRNIAQATPDDRARIRNQEIGFVFQSFNLLPKLSALDNVALPLFYRGYSRSLSRKHALHQIQKIGLGSRALDKPAELSGGQRQRIAIARALVGSPSLILADEPTGNLDHATALETIELLLNLNREQKVTLVMVTHDLRLANRLGQRFEVKDKMIVELTQLG